MEALEPFREHLRASACYKVVTLVDKDALRWIEVSEASVVKRLKIASTGCAIRVSRLQGASYGPKKNL
jgi:hypothetical protein